MRGLKSHPRTKTPTLYLVNAGGLVITDFRRILHQLSQEVLFLLTGYMGILYTHSSTVNLIQTVQHFTEILCYKGKISYCWDKITRITCCYPSYYHGNRIKYLAGSRRPIRSTRGLVVGLLKGEVSACLNPHCRYPWTNSSCALRRERWRDQRERERERE